MNSRLKNGIVNVCLASFKENVAIKSTTINFYWDVFKEFHVHFGNPNLFYHYILKKNLMHSDWKEELLADLLHLKTIN